MEREGFRHEAEPVAGEGFVFVVNKDNPVDTLTVEQIKGIYSGESQTKKKRRSSHYEKIHLPDSDAAFCT